MLFDKLFSRNVTGGFIKAFSEHAILQGVNVSEKYLKYIYKYSYEWKDGTWRISSFGLDVTDQV